MFGKWTRWLGLAVVILALTAVVVPTTRADGLDVSVNMRSNGGFVELARGETLHVNLPSRDGFLVWTVTAYDDGVLGLHTSNTTAPSSFAFTALRPGLTTIHITNMGRAPRPEDFTLNVLVTER